MKKLFLFGALLFCFTFSKAQEKLTLLECVEIAVENNLNLAQSSITQRKNEANYDQSKKAWLPNLNSNIGFGNQWGLAVDPTTDNVSTQSFQSGSGGIGSSTTLYNGGRIKNTVKLQGLLIDRTNSSMESIKEDIAVDVAARFVDVLSRKEQIKISATQVELREQDLERVLKLIEGGVSPASARYDQEAQLANARFQVVQAQNGLQSALLLLKQSMNVAYDRDIDIVDPNLDVPSKSELIGLEPSLVLTSAIEKNGAIKGALKSEEISSLNIELAEANKYPSVSLNGNLGASASSLSRQLAGTQVIRNVPVDGLFTQDGLAIVRDEVIIPQLEDKPLTSQIQDNFSQSVSMSINIPIFNNGQTKNAIRQAELDLENTKIGTQIQIRALDQRIQTAYLQAELAFEQYEAAKIQLASLEKASEIAKKRYDLGAGSVYDYFAAENNVNSSKLQLSQAKYDLIYKIKILEFYKDNSFTF